MENPASACRGLIPAPFDKLMRQRAPNSRRKSVARVTRLVCDNCGNEVEEAKGAVMRINFTDARRGSKQADLCDACAGKMPGQQVARRGRRPKSAAA
jgi:ribosomal protein S26